MIPGAFLKILTHYDCRNGLGGSPPEGDFLCLKFDGKNLIKETEMLKRNKAIFAVPAIVAAGLMVSQPTWADSVKKASPEVAATVVGKKIATENELSNVLNYAKDQMSAAQKRAIKDAVEALRATESAIIALDKKDKAKAMSHLEKALGKLDVVLSLDPDLKLAPISIGSTVIDADLNVKTINEIKSQAIKLMKEGRLQDARPLVASLASEIVIRVSKIPLGTYPAAIKKAVPLIEKGKMKEAKAVLITALNLLVIEDRIVPLPIVRAQALLAEAEVLTENAKRTKSQEADLKTLLNDARKQLKLAEVLGYGQVSDFASFYKQIAEIAKKTEGGKSSSGFFDVIKKDLKSLRKKLF